MKTATETATRDDSDETPTKSLGADFFSVCHHHPTVDE